jgi:class 3 adenylate cyclase/DNA-binding NarL/FixJ family response regulator
MPDPIAHELTFLFTDVEGSTRLLEQLGPGYGIVLEKHRALITAAIESNDGRVVDCRGDEFFAAFPDCTGAVAAAVAAQRAVAAEAWPPGLPVRVRMGVHTGRAHSTGDGFVGLAVHHAARVCQTARGGEILVSDTVARDGFDAVDVGEHLLRGIPRATRLFRIVAAGLETEFPALPGAVPSEAPVRVALADDSVLLREGIAALLEEEGFEVIGQAGTGVDLLALVDEALPDVAIVDIRMPPTKTDEGIRATHEIKRRHPRTGVLLLSSYLDVKSAVELFAAQPNGIGYLLKERVADVDDFTEAVRRVAGGGTVLDVAIREVLRSSDPSDRERAILALVEPQRVDVELRACGDGSDQAGRSGRAQEIAVPTFKPDPGEMRRV